jgi:hypothetical protein
MMPPVLLPDMLGHGPLIAALAAFAPSATVKITAAKITQFQRITTSSRTQYATRGEA